MKWKLLSVHIRKCPQCKLGNLQRKKKNLWSKDIKFMGTKTIGMECSKEECNFFITLEKLRELAPRKKVLKARKLLNRK